MTLEKHMMNEHLFWSWYEPRNFGDWIGPYLYQKIRKRPPIFCPKKQQQSQSCVFSVGSILRHIIHRDRVIVWGSGVISNNDNFQRPLETLAVRGPRTREVMKRLGYDCPEVFGDPAVLLPLFFQPIQKRSQKRIGIIPHFVEFAEYITQDWPDAIVIDVCRPIEQVIADIASVELTYSSSLHGLIVSHAYGVPSIWMESSKPLAGDGIKFADYFASCGLSQTARKSLLADSRSIRDESLQSLPDHGELISALTKSAPSGWRF